MGHFIYYTFIHVHEIQLTGEFSSSEGVTIEFTYKNPYFTAYTTGLITTFDLLISKLYAINYNNIIRVQYLF